MNYEITKLAPTFGAAVTGVDFLHPLTDMEVQELNDLFHQYKLVVFRHQNLSPEEQIKACRQFGEIELHPAENVPWGHRELTYVANTDMTLTQVFEHSGPPFELWHSDTCYLEMPARISMLYAERVPSFGGETLFADMVEAYEDLPGAIKARLEDKRAVFGSGLNLMERCQKRGYFLQIPENETKPDAIHPVIRTHPQTKDKSIFVNWAHTDRILDISLEESDELLSYLYEHSRSSKYVYAYHPQNGDLMVWDNASLIHSNSDKKLTDIRIMRRVMIKGSVPY